MFNAHIASCACDLCRPACVNQTHTLSQSNISYISSRTEFHSLNCALDAVAAASFCATQLICVVHSMSAVRIHSRCRDKEHPVASSTRCRFEDKCRAEQCPGTCGRAVCSKFNHEPSFGAKLLTFVGSTSRKLRNSMRDAFNVIYEQQMVEN